MRMEAYNQVTRITYFRNIAYSVAIRHQKLAYGYLQSKKFFCYDDVQCGPCKQH